MSPDQELAMYTGVPTFNVQLPALTPANLAAIKGQTALFIPDSSSNQNPTMAAAAQTSLAPKLGMNFINCTNQGQLTQWVSCYSQAVQRKVNVVEDWGGVDPRQLGPQIAAAQSAGINVIGLNNTGASQPILGGMKWEMPWPYELAGRLMADWVVKDTNANADVLVVVSNEVGATDAILASIRAVFAQFCPNCKITVFNAAVKDWSTQITTNVQSALVRDPNINYVIPIYDGMTEYVIPAIQAANKNGKVFVSTWNATPFVLDDMRNGDIVRMDVGIPMNWVGYADTDATVRVAAGVQAPGIIDENLPVRVFTKDNVSDAGVPADITKGYGDSYIAGYMKLWGLSS
jgi:ribose transport system substrate-binding protein